MKTRADARDEKTKITFDAYYPSDKSIEKMLLEAEYIRCKILEIKQFRIKDDDTIQFIAADG